MIQTISQDREKSVRAQSNLQSKFKNNVHSTDIDEVWYGKYGVDERTKVILSQPVSIVHKVGKHDVNYSLSPYQTDEQGYVNKYAQSSNVLRFLTESDFEKQIVVNQNAAELLEVKLKSKSWSPAPIVLSGNIDCYHPVERKIKVTRSLLELFLKYKHPVRVETKSALILRDMDLLTELAKHDLVSVVISFNTLNNELHNAMESGTSSPKKRMQIVKMLASKGIPVIVSVPSIIPGLNDEGIFTLVKVAAEHGAKNIQAKVVRLNSDVSEMFKMWVRKNFPYRWRKILRKVSSMHKNNLTTSEHGARMRSNGNYANMIRQQFIMAKKTYNMDGENFEYNRSLYDGTPNPQMSLF